MRFFSLRLVLLVLLAALPAACQRTADRAASGPADVTFDRQQAAAIQDSLAQTVEPGHFHAALAGDPFSRGTGAAVENLDPHGTVRVEAAGGQEGVTRFAMDSEDEAYAVELLLERPAAAADSSAAPPAGAYVQRSGQLPTVTAVLEQGRRRFESRSGSLVLEEADSTGMTGRFFFEMQRAEAPSGDWFSFVGVFGPVEMPQAAGPRAAGP